MLKGRREKHFSDIGRVLQFMLVSLELPMVYAESIVYWDCIDKVWELNSQAFSFSVPKLWGPRKSLFCHAVHKQPRNGGTLLNPNMLPQVLLLWSKFQSLTPSTLEIICLKFSQIFQYTVSCEYHMTSCEGDEVNQQRLGIMVTCYKLAYLTACLRKTAKHQKVTILVSSCGALYYEHKALCMCDHETLHKHVVQHHHSDSNIAYL